MKLNGAWWLVTALGLGFVVAANATGCGSDTSNNTTTGSGGSGGEAGATGSSSSSSSGTPKADFLGTECSSDAECIEGALKGICIKSTDTDPVLQGGPSNGYCSLPCNTSGDCYGLANICFKPSGAAEGRCLLGCEVGPVELMYLDDPLDSQKCHGREDVSCFELTAGTACLPTCARDTDCPSGRYCNYAAGVCLDLPDPAPETKFGSNCTSDADCDNGFCIGGLPNGQKFCTGFCALGGSITYGDCGGLENGICVYSLADGAGAGDVGVCAGGCTKHDDCAAPGMWCSTVQGAPVGYCFPAKACTAQTDCVDMAGNSLGTCTDTTVGKWCLDDYPLGTFQPMGTGGAGGMGGGGMGGAGGMGGGMGGMGGGGMGGGGMGGAGGT